MSVGYLCDAIPAYLPHELLGFKKESLQGTLLSVAIVNKINVEKNAQTTAKGPRAGQAQRYAKHKSLR